MLFSHAWRKRPILYKLCSWGRFSNCSSRTHCNTDFSFFQCWGVINTITSHSSDITILLKIFDNLWFMAWFNTSEKSFLDIKNKIGKPLMIGKMCQLEKSQILLKTVPSLKTGFFLLRSCQVIEFSSGESLAWICVFHIYIKVIFVVYLRLIHLERKFRFFYRWLQQ